MLTLHGLRKQLHSITVDMERVYRLYGMLLSPTDRERFLQLREDVHKLAERLDLQEQDAVNRIAQERD